MSDDKYKVGKQPCNSLDRQPGCIEAAPERPNVHECYRGCGKTVTFCLNCFRDHHEDGYESCIARQQPSPAPSRSEALDS